MVEQLVDQLIDAGANVTQLCDVRCWPSHTRATPIAVQDNQWRETLQQTGEKADGIWIIAPESNHRLLAATQAVRQFVDKLVCPSIDLVRLASDKLVCKRHLSAAGIPVPPTCTSTTIEPGAPIQCEGNAPSDWKAPEGFVIKPRWGAGGEGMVWWRAPLNQFPPCDPNEIAKPSCPKSSKASETSAAEWLVEPFIPGLPVSAAVIGGPQQKVELPPTQQILDPAHFGRYLGSRYPLPESLDRRARKLVRRTIEAFPDWRGYIGIDMILGTRANDDCVVEINPRLTSSYLLLCQRSQKNLAQMIWRVATGGRAELPFDTRSLTLRLGDREVKTS